MDIFSNTNLKPPFRYIKIPSTGPTIVLILVSAVDQNFGVHRVFSEKGAVFFSDQIYFTMLSPSIPKRTKFLLD